MPRPHTASLRVRLLLLVLAAVVPALGVILHTALQQRRVAAAEARREATGLARSVAVDQQRLVIEARQFLSLLAQLEQVRGGDPNACSTLLARLLVRGQRYANLGVIRPDGEVVCSALPTARPLNLADRPYFRRAVAARDFAVGDYQIGRITRQATINFAYPVLGPGDRVQGVVFAALPLSWIRERIAAAQLPRGSTITVVDPTLTVLAHYPGGEAWVGKTVRGSALANAIRAVGGSGTADAVGPDGVERLYSVTRLQDVAGSEPVHIAVGIPTQVAYAAVDRALARNLVVLALLGVLMLAAAWWGSDLFVLRQLRALLAATRRLAAGDLRARAPVAGDRGELTELARGFNDMAAAIEQRDEEIQAHLERIARLNRAHALLSGVNSVMLRIRDEDELQREICRVAVEEGKLPLAALYRRDPEGNALELRAWASSVPTGQEELLARERQGVGGGVLEAVLERRDAVVARDPDADPRLAGWRTLMQSHGYGSVAALPLHGDSAPAGALVLFAAAQDSFDGEELALLRDLAADTSFGLRFLAAQHRLEYLANYDPLTGLPNRTLFTDRLQQAIARAEQRETSLAVLAVRINRIAQVNATMGHHAGDVVLRSVGRYLAGAVRDGDTVARLGSGEFGVVLADLPEPGDAATLANELLSSAPQMIPVDGEQVFVALSIGVAIYPVDGTAVPELVQASTLARQAAASETAGTLTFYSREINAQAQEKRRLEHELRRALEQDQFLLWYQPVVDVRRRVVIGVESLVRWESPGLGFVSPGRFIPVAEETGLIGPLGEWIIVTACRQGRNWRRRGITGVRINVNVSVRQLRDPDFVVRLRQILRETGCDPHDLALGLEITESELMENLQAAVDAIQCFREMGLAIYIDDFGTGYSSLAYLRRLPIDTLKIDTSFIRDIPGDADAVAIVKGIIAMAHSLELRVIAEGVETEEQFATLAELGCEAVQGFLFGRPGPPEEVEPLLGRSL